MGITIHFTARVADSSRVGVAIDAVVAAAEARGWAAQRFAKQQATLRRSADEREWEYTGPTEGVVLTPHELCEPLCLEFDRDGVAQDYVKTQFAGPDTHAGVIELLREVKPTLDSLVVFDEGEYWDTSDRGRLVRQIEECNAQLAQHLENNRRVRGPLRLANGRMLDLVGIDDGEAARTRPWWKFWSQ